MTNLNFTISELVYSDTAKKYNINNMPDLKTIDNLLKLIFFCLQPIRNRLKKPMIISSGYRCNTLNKIVGGVSNSGHLNGTSADFIVKGMQIEEIYQIIKNSDIKYTQLIQEKGQWIHIQYNSSNLKCENLRYDGKKYVKD